MRKIPAMMRAAAIDQFGGPEVLTIHTVPVPEIAATEILIAVDTAGVGVWDLGIREGKWAETTRFPKILGTDGSGIVAAVGSRVTRFAVGDRVYAYSYENPKGGFYAEYVAVAASKAGTPPESIDLVHAGAAAVIGLTALQGVDDTLGIAGRENVIIHGASGNVGFLALQFAKLRGARVLATASGPDGKAFARRLGADEAVDGKRTDILAAARKFAPDGIDAVLAFVGGKELTRCMDALRKGGRVAYPNGVEPAPRKRKGVKVQAYDAVAGPRELERLGRALEEGEVQVPIAAEFRLERAADAHRRIAKGHLLGKIVLRT
jgi:NADPH:quinone reductase-like Zn-dependent oxidoreductase